MGEWAVSRRAGLVRRSRGRARLLVLLTVVACVLAAYAYRHRPAPWPALAPAPVVGASRIIDGDTIEVWGQRIRLEAIDAPELGQTCRDAQGRKWTCGVAAARELRRRIDGQELTCEPSGLDRYQRVLAICFLRDGSDLNAWMVRQGWALAFRSTTRYRAEQNEAESLGRGIWAGSFMPPWEWRQHH